MPSEWPYRSRIAYGASEEQYGELWLPDPEASTSAPLMILYHGGFWKSMYGSALMDGLARDLVGRGMSVWNVEYRRLGVGGGWPMTYDDAAAALAKVPELPGVDPHKIITCGHSAGGHIALWVAMNADGSKAGVPTLRGAIALAGVLDLVDASELDLGSGAVRRLLGGLPFEREEQYEAASLIAGLPLGTAQVIVHGTKDDVVPFEISVSYAERATDAGDAVDLVLVEGADHMSMIDPGSPAWKLAVQRTEQLLE